MIAVVVYDSLWGNTQAIAEEIAAGLGAGARAMSTTEATPDVVAAAQLVVAGSPVHALSLPTKESKHTGERQGAKPEFLTSDTSLMLMRDWLRTLPRTGAAAAAFDTHMPGPFGRGGASRIQKALRRAGYRIVVNGEGFIVDGIPASGERAALLREGERKRAREWGMGLLGAALTVAG